MTFEKVQKILAEQRNWMPMRSPWIPAWLRTWASTALTLWIS